MFKRLTYVIVFCSIGLLGRPGLTLAGGTIIRTVQNGDWNEASIWDLGVPDESQGHQAKVAHVVTVTNPSANANVTTVGHDDGPGTLSIQADFNPGSCSIGSQGNMGTVTMSAGTVTIVNGGIFVGTNTGPGAMTISGGSLNVPRFDVGNDFDGSLRIEGGSATISTSTLYINGNGTITIAPTANGPGGLTSISVTSVDTVSDVDNGAVLVLDTSDYSPQIGDEWDIISYGPASLSGGFGTLTAPPGYAIEEDHTLPGVVTIRVTAVPAGGIPAMSEWGLVALGLTILIMGTLTLARLRPAIA